MMSSQPIVCAACDAPVPYGRLSCPACGELLASVAGAARPPVARATTKRATKRSTAAAVPPVLMDVPPPSVAVATPEPVASEELDWDPPVWDATAANTNDRDLLEWPVPGSAPDPRRHAGGGTVDAGGGSSVGAAGGGSGVGALDSVDTVAPATNGAHGVGPSAAAAVALASSPAVPWASGASAAGVSAPGAYVPPVPAIPAGPPAPARAWAGQSNGDAAGSDSDESRTSAAELLDAARLPEFIGWLAVAGAALAAVGFVLPWGISVIGARGVGYFDRWGLAGPFHPIVFGSLLGLLALSLVRNPIPLWVRVGLPGLGLGALLIGLVWPYLVGLSGTGPGALVVAIGAMALGVAGLAALATDRHVVEDRPA